MRDLPPALAYPLLHPNDPETKAYLIIPSNLNQHYHFAAKNWARFYTLVENKMGAAWQANFQQAVANNGEKRRPSDGSERHLTMTSFRT